MDIPAYKWLSRFSFAFALEAFVFISGYLFAFQNITLKRTTRLTSLIVNKLKRLILPSIIFSAIYFLLFYEYKGLGNLIYSIINGCGHMWFLPMLFWCFIGLWFLQQVKIEDGWKLAFLLFLNVFCFKSLPLQLDRTAVFLLYFYGGYVVYKYSNVIKKSLTFDIMAFSWVVFLIVFILFRSLRDEMIADPNNSRILNGLIYARKNLIRVLYASLGLLAFYFTAVYYTQRKSIKVFTVKLASYCFGIYLFQQFFLQYLYYKTSFPTIVGPYWLPWLGFAIATLLSYLMAHLLLKTKIGKFLIG